MKKLKNYLYKFQKIGELTPSDIGINSKFCLDKTTDELMQTLKKNIINININENNKIDQNYKSKKTSKLVSFLNHIVII